MHIMTTLLDKILDRQNMYQAFRSVCSNKGASGVDGITINEIDGYIRENWQRIKVEIEERSYRPQPVLRVEIPKPNGGTRKLGIPTAMDRIIQQAIVQVLSPIAEKEFSGTSYGYRPGRNCEMAVVKLLEYFNDGYLWVVDIDLEKFFDTVPQDKLMSLVHNIINDPDTESLIRKFLQAGIMDKGEYRPSKRQWGLQKLGVNKDLARLTSYCGDRYYFVATKTCVSRAISKAILTQRGLISPLDYYEHRRNVRFN